MQPPTQGARVFLFGFLPLDDCSASANERLYLPSVEIRVSLLYVACYLTEWLARAFEVVVCLSIDWPWIGAHGATADFPFVNGRCHFLTVDAIIGNQAFQNERCHICFSLGLDKVETGIIC